MDTFNNENDHKDLKKAYNAFFDSLQCNNMPGFPQPSYTNPGRKYIMKSIKFFEKSELEEH